MQPLQSMIIALTVSHGLKDPRFYLDSAVEIQEEIGTDPPMRTQPRVLAETVIGTAIVQRNVRSQEGNQKTSIGLGDLSVTAASKKASKLILDRVPCVHYLVKFKWNKCEIKISALINSSSVADVTTPAYTKQLGLWTQKTDVGAQKIDGSLLETDKMVTAGSQVMDGLGKARFFQETFLLADISMEVVFEMLFLTLSNVDIQFAKKKLTKRPYTAVKALPTIKQVELINKRKFAKASLDKRIEAFVVHKLTKIMPEQTGINEHASEFVDRK